MTLAVDALLRNGAPAEEAVRGFLRSHDFPLVEGARVTFVYWDDAQDGEADDVRLRHHVYGLPSAQRFERVRGTRLWVLPFDLPRDSRMEYKLEIARGNVRRLILDPLNPRVATDPYGTNSVCHGTGYVTPEWTFPDPEARPGSLEEIRVRSEAFGEERAVTMYLPARMRRRRRYPLLVAHDGPDYLRFAGLRTVLDNLIHRHEVPGMVVALTRPSDRLREYMADDRHTRFVADELVPHLEERYPLARTAATRGLLGASLGAVASLCTAWNRPGVFGRLLLQSGSFAFTDIGPSARGSSFEAVVRFVNGFRANPGRPAERLFVSCGVYEGVIYENRSLVPLLQAAGLDVRYVEARDGHNWENWRDRLREGLSWLFPGPLWMVYE
jgi:enterochelin esterase family protein